jgi:hypothetical protein
MQPENQELPPPAAAWLIVKTGLPAPDCNRCRAFGPCVRRNRIFKFRDTGPLTGEASCFFLGIDRRIDDKQGASLE